MNGSRAVKEVEQPKPYYSFGYDIVDEEGNQQHRTEVSDGAGTVRGTYGFLDRNGYARQVAFIADNFGFRASVSSNEPNQKSHQPAAVVFSAGEESTSQEVVPTQEAIGQPLALRMSKRKSV